MLSASRKNSRLRVGLFGGAFDPPHLGHQAICRWLLAKNQVDQIWVIPCFIHPLGKKLAPFGERLTMCRFAFQEFRNRVRVLDVERRLSGISYTVRTILHLKERYLDFNFSLVLGADIQAEADQWKDFAKIRQLVPLIYLPRGEMSPIPDVSATDIRQRIRKGQRWHDLVSVEVAVCIITHGLYH